MGHKCSKCVRPKVQWIQPNSLSPEREILFPSGELFMAEISRTITGDVGLLNEAVYDYCRPVVAGLRPGQEAHCTVRDQLGDWSLVTVSVRERSNKRIRQFMSVRSAISPVPCVHVDLEIWNKLKETFHENSFKMGAATLVMRTKEFGFLVMTNGRVFKWDISSKAFKVIVRWKAIYRHYGIMVNSLGRLDFHDLKAGVPFDPVSLVKFKDVALTAAPVFDQHAKRTLQYALVEGGEWFAFYDTRGEKGTEFPVFFDSMEFINEFQMLLGHMEIPHVRFKENHKIVNGRHLPIYMNNVNFAVLHDYHFAFIHNPITGIACKILEGNIGVLANFGNCLVDIEANTVLEQVAYYG